MTKYGEKTNKEFMIEVVGHRPSFYDVPNTCTEEEAGTEIEATVEVSFGQRGSFLLLCLDDQGDGVTVTNTTACQIPVSGLVAVLAVNTTTQKPGLALADTEQFLYMAMVNLSLIHI